MFQEVPDQTFLLAEVVRVIKPHGYLAAMMVCLEDTMPANRAYSHIAEDYMWYFKSFTDMKQMVDAFRLKMVTEEQQFSKNPIASLVERDNTMQFPAFHAIMRRIAQAGEMPEHVSHGHYKFIAQKCR